MEQTTTSPPHSYGLRSRGGSRATKSAAKNDAAHPASKEDIPDKVDDENSASDKFLLGLIVALPLVFLLLLLAKTNTTKAYLLGTFCQDLARRAYGFCSLPVLAGFAAVALFVANLFLARRYRSKAAAAGKEEN